METSENVKETFKRDVDQIEMDLKRNILMIEDQEDVVPTIPLPEQENANEDVCRNPTLAKCGGEAQHFQSWGFGVLRDSQMFRARQQGPKHLALRCSWCHWKGLEA